MAYALVQCFEKGIKITNSFVYKKLLMKWYKQLKILNFINMDFKYGALGILFVIKRIEHFFKIKSCYVRQIVDNYEIFFNSKEKEISKFLVLNFFLKINIIET